MKSHRKKTALLLVLTSVSVSMILLAFSANSLSNKVLNLPASSVMPGNEEFPYEIGESHSFKNLQIFFLTTDQSLLTKEYICLSEALTKKYITVFETGNVNQLAVSNSSDHYLFIYAGEIVKGGRQDRTLGKDLILPPRSGKIPIASFCVESGRWHPRQQEESDEFVVSGYALSSRDLKVAAKKSNDQSAVWENVSRQQEKMNSSMVENYDYDESFDIKDEVSATSLQLTLENEELQKIKAAYERYFKKLTLENTDAIGFAYAINGELYGIDIFLNAKLFKDLWPKLLDAAIIEAISEQTKEEIKYMSPSAIMNLLDRFYSDKAQELVEEINSETTYRTRTTDQMVKFETFDKREGNKLLHVNYIALEADNEGDGSLPGEARELNYQDILIVE